MANFIRYHVGDVVQMKKAHPCGSNEWEVLRIGVDFVIRCCGCGHRVMIPRSKFEKAVKKMIKSAEPSQDNANL
ncbi:MAG: DUF951 domain-containing protein [Megasphaera sp.]|nr:DUF951 domain-containing protein [Megasphaera sp.]MCH4218565.1 DUF951 domain-containing protein [Megasphaera sp.]